MPWRAAKSPWWHLLAGGIVGESIGLSCLVTQGDHMVKSVKGRWALVLACITMPVAAAGQGLRPLFGVGFGLAIPNGAYHSDANSNDEGFDTGWVGTMLAGVKLPKPRS